MIAKTSICMTLAGAENAVTLMIPSHPRQSRSNLIAIHD
jgi:hypothetical protein